MKSVKGMAAAMAIVGSICTATHGDPTSDQAPKPDSPRIAAPADLDLSKPTLFMVGYAHLDTQWRWTYVTTIREYIANTLHDNFALMDKYPDYVFNFSGSRRYRMMQEYYPDDFEKLRFYVAKGQWFPCGSSVDENDANVPSAESLIRHVLYGNKFFRKEFGIASDEYMLPDCFGFPAALPSVLAHCGIRGFSTQKLTWGSAVGIPFKVGVWEGPDGKGVIAALDPGAYVGEVREDLSASDSWLTRVNNNGKLSGMFADYHYYGTGDQGGAPTEESVQMVEKSLAGKGPLKIVSSHSDWLFNAITPEMRDKLPRYKGELLLTQHSAGSITSQATMKRWNRKNELLADAAERAAVIAHWLGAEYPGERLENAWYLVLGSQMHDILPGTSHPKAYEFAWNDELIAANQFSAVLTDSVGMISSALLNTNVKGTPIVVYNPLSIEREDIVEAAIPLDGKSGANISVTDPDGKPVRAQSQIAGGIANIKFPARVPAVGFAVYDVQFDAAPPQIASELSIDERHLENAHYRVTINDDGDVASIYDKHANREVLSGPARLALMFERPAQWPAWNMDWKDRQQPPRSYVGGPAKFAITERGPARIALQITREHEGSTYVQEIRLASGAAGDRVEFDNTIDWTTRERSLKAVFPLAAHNPIATYDIQVGAIERDNNNEKRYENPSHQWFDLTDQSGDYGVTVMNDSKFGSDKPDDSTLRLTLLYTPGTSGDYQDQATQDFGRHHILFALAGHEKNWRDARTPWIAARLNQPLRTFAVPKHDGPARTFSFCSVSDPDVMISAMKKAEGDDSVIVRLRELTGKPAKNVRMALNAPITNARLVDGQERSIGPAVIENGSLITDVDGYSLRACAITPAAAKQHASSPTSHPLSLPFDIDVVSSNKNRSDGALDPDGRTYPAEQLGEKVIAGGVQFQLGKFNDGENNALKCAAQTIALPGGRFNRIELLAASTDGDQHASFAIDGAPHDASIPNWRGYIGQWDNRVWLGDVPEIAYNWSATYGGLDPGYIKSGEVAWFCSHHHLPAGDQYYEYCYLYKIALDCSPGVKSLTLPDNKNIMIFAATAVNDAADRAQPAAPLFDTLKDRSQDAPRIIPAGGTFADSTPIEIEPHLYGRAGAICYTLDGSDPTANSNRSESGEPKLLLNQTTTVRAAVIDHEGKLGPETKLTFTINDSTPPRITKAEAHYNQAKLRIDFHEPLDPASAGSASNYSLTPAIAIRSVELQQSGNTPAAVMLTLDAPLQSGKSYELKVQGVKDNSPNHNSISDAAVTIAAPAPVFHLAEVSADQRGKAIHPEKPLPIKAGDQWTLNLFVKTDKQPPNRTLLAGFGACGNNADATGRYLCKFSNGIHFWSHHCDLQGNTPLDLNKWQMVTATYDGDHLRLYKNGEQISEREAKLADDESVIYIAPIDPWEHRRQFEGEVRELTVWNAALDQQAIKSLQNGVSLP